MTPVRPQDVRHKVELLRLLTKIVDNGYLAHNLYFKGGTCASMLGYLDRFSIDLDFDLNPKVDVRKIRAEFDRIFKDLNLSIKDQSQKVPEYFLGYVSPPNQRNTIKLDAFGPVFEANIYKPQFLPEIDRLVNCQTIETMFANKLIAPLNRFEKSKSIAGRDFYDLHHFFYSGYKYEPKIILERTKLEPTIYLGKLIKFITDEVSQRHLDEDLSTLLPVDAFHKIRKILKTELVTFLTDEIQRI